jgi:formylglycine-generating enzyme required for sulfatase activity
MKSAFLTLCMIVTFFSGILANNVAMNNISLTDQYYQNHTCNIKFDISWENSWRTSTTVPGNWDACWVFAKYRVAGGPWHHCTLSNNINDFTCPGGCTIMPSSDGTGVFIYRSQDGYGNNNWTLLTLMWKYGLDGINDDAEVEVKLFAIEMIYVPQGNFYLGDGNGTDESQYAFHSGTSNSAVQITSELVPNIQIDYAPYDDAELQDGIGIDGDGGIDPNNDGIIDNPLYPTGFKAFYIMKYEISQEQYMEFLNTLTRQQQQARIESDISSTPITNVYVMSDAATPVDANGIRCISAIPAVPQPVTFFCDVSGNGQTETCDGQALDCNKLSWSDVCAYSDWAGLRLMTELEFEKSTRGPNNPVYAEYAWGNTNLAGSSNESTYNLFCPNSYNVLDPDVNTGRASCYETGNAIIGLIRCGEFAASSVNHTRQESGAGYYGEMEMSGAMTEPIVTIGNVAGRSYNAINGDGELIANGDANTDYWPGINGNSESWTANGPYGGTTGVTGDAGSGLKGGNMSTYHQFMCISNRYFCSMGYPLSRQTYHGGRFVRYAP